jgi:hypothetical protein
MKKSEKAAACLHRGMSGLMAYVGIWSLSKKMRIWLMDGFNVIADNAVGFNPGPSWNVVGQQDLIGG